MKELRDRIRDIPDFPKKGIIFKDITPLLADVSSFQKVVDIFAKRYANQSIDYVVGIESRGFIFGAATAYRLDAGFIPVRKPGKLPYETHRVDYELEYGTDSIEIHVDALHEGNRVVIIDDLLATGGTAGAACQLVQKAKATIVECGFVVELEFLKGREKLKGTPSFSLIQY
ncbi:MAG: adenine phosphoribosyltransferase [Deltaproteobacteria bacterium RIFCSPLOWO2_02_FULL_50_16]|nr:MAG: adenine phosphoribosyltransferase [Deltaproteobacteria bacterium GWA2_50_8]OGQ25727.1 MAG: adenine phosphoribosyltransferase [Deltaproteobacteria bacterium RIFCSPHIGHO2_02_FULL_50_15]OGQ56990.1 MAG: adenine phosphoribosyltransferase [Deltaproteobacteria bacterium RIFCSPLOWO2_02_FULL_50_16]OGQ68068.1 MAG: adenine phosphoribosyltransferase [Deltaproteobacteria bacterium RIFCSPLOWO2_12_FULL_50_11]